MRRSAELGAPSGISVLEGEYTEAVREDDRTLADVARERIFSFQWWRMSAERLKAQQQGKSMQKRFVSNGILRVGRAIAVLFFLVLIPGTQGAYAQEAANDPLTNVGQFEGENGSVLLFATDNLQKLAELGIRNQNSDEHYRYNGTYKDMSTTFQSGKDWQKFVSLWAEASSSRAETNRDGIWFAGPVLITADKDHGGEVLLTISANPDEHAVPRDLNIFYLAPKDFAAFDETVKKISAYFGN